MRDKQWITKDGSKINVNDMTDKHVERVLNMLRKKKGNRLMLKVILEGIDSIEKQVSATNKPFTLNGDMAQHDIEMNELNDELFDYDNYDPTGQGGY